MKDETLLAFVKGLLDQQVYVLHPEVAPQSFCGYAFPSVQNRLHLSPGDEIAFLNYLAELGVFERHLQETIHLCPYCQNWALHFREVCPHCQDPRVHSVEMMHHYGCGCVAPQEQFRSGSKMVCPKCHQLVRHLGVDYERPASTFQCESCQALFAEPEISCRSLVCGRSFPVDHATIHHLYGYHLTERASVVVASGRLNPMKGEATFIDAEYQVYTSQFFEEEVTREMHRATRSKRPFCVAMIRPDNLPPFEHRFGKPGMVSLSQTIAEVARQSVRASDLVARYFDSQLALLLPETSGDRGGLVANRLRRSVQVLTQDRFGTSIGLDVGLVEFPGPHQSTEALIQSAISQLTEPNPQNSEDSQTRSEDGP